MSGAFTHALKLNGWSTFQRLWYLIQWRRHWNHYDPGFLPDSALSTKFTSAAEAVKLIPNDAVVVSSGFAGCGICSALFWALRDAYLATQTPANLTWITVGAQGGRGKVPGTIEELAQPGLLKRYIAGHLETARALLKLGEAGGVELHTLPQGTLARLFALQGEGIKHYVTETGIGSFLDPELGGGTAVTPDAQKNYVSRHGGALCYRLPEIQVALLSVPYADREGNLYFHDDPSISENYEVVRAATRNGGTVIAMVGALIDKSEAQICVPADQVDAITLHPQRPQIAGVPLSKKWDAFLPETAHDPHAAVAMVRCINTLLGITPKRSELDQRLAEDAADLVQGLAKPGALSNFGVGLPEEVGRILYDRGCDKQLLFSTEGGALGGVPTPGIFFGAAVKPDRIESSDQMFQRYRQHLDVSVLGFLQVDSAGNVNVSQRGSRVTQFVGPGGFCDIVACARTIVFVGSWMVGGALELAGGKLSITQPGKAKFVDKVDQITFSASEALKRGQQVYYVSNVGVFKLTAQGLALVSVAPGIDIQRDIINGCCADISLAV